MRRLGILLIAAALLLMPAAAHAHASEPAEDTILGMSYGTAALATAGVVAGAVALGSYAGASIGTVAVTLYVAHWVVQGAVLYGAGSWLGWWDDEAPAEAVTLLKD